jgi:hypothetical protein
VCEDGLFILKYICRLTFGTNTNKIHVCDVLFQKSSVFCCADDCPLLKFGSGNQIYSFKLAAVIAFLCDYAAEENTISVN